MVTELSNNSFSEKVIYIIKRIPAGKVLTYGATAIIAGNPKGARGVSWILHSSSRKHSLPWYRVINSRGKISIPAPGSEEQKFLLEKEGIVFDNDKIDLKQYLWNIKSIEEIISENY